MVQTLPTSTLKNSYMNAVQKKPTPVQSLTTMVDKLKSQVMPTSPAVKSGAILNTDPVKTSIAALSGNTAAQRTLMSSPTIPQAGGGATITKAPAVPDWSKVTPAQLSADKGLRQQYMAANPYADYTKQYDKNNYDTYTKMLTNGQQLSPDQMKWYQNAATKWNLDDYTNPLMQQYGQQANTTNAYLDSLNNTNNAYNNQADSYIGQLNNNQNGYNSQYDEFIKAIQGGKDAMSQQVNDYLSNLQNNLNGYNSQFDNYIGGLQNDENGILAQYAKARQSGLDGQDIALNSGLTSLDAQGMQLQQQLQQQMADRGMMDSGVAADTYMRGQMGMNQNYQQAYSDAANKKAQIESDYTDKTSNIKRQYADAINAAQMAKLNKGSETLDKTNSAKMGQIDWNNQQDSNINNAKMGKLDKQSSTNSAINDVKNGKIAQQDAYNKAAYGANSDLNTAKANAQNTIAQQKYQQAKDALDRQDARDKFLTQQSGILYVNGKPVVGKDGKPLTTIDAQKVQETSRHNQATETLTSQKNAADYQLGSQKNAIAAQKVSNDYALGSQKNAIAGQKVAADLSKFSQTMQLNYAKLDYNYAKLDASNKQAQDKLGVAMDNAQTAADKNKIATVSKLLDNSTKQIMAYQKSGKKPPKQLVSDYNDALGKMKSLSDPGAASKSKSSSSKSSKSSKSKSSGTKSSTSLTGKSAPMYS